MAADASEIDEMTDGASRGTPSAGTAGTFDRVLLAVDGDTDDRVREVALSIAATHGGHVDALSVVPMDASVDRWDMVVERREAEAEAALDAVGEAAERADVSVSKWLRYGTPAEEIGLYADGNDVDLVVVGEPDRSRLERFLSPTNVATAVRRVTSAPVVSVPAADATDE